MFSARLVDARVNRVASSDVHARQRAEKDIRQPLWASRALTRERSWPIGSYTAIQKHSAMHRPGAAPPSRVTSNAHNGGKKAGYARESGSSRFLRRIALSSRRIASSTLAPAANDQNRGRRARHDATRRRGGSVARREVAGIERARQSTIERKRGIETVADGGNRVSELASERGGEEQDRVHERE